MPRLDTLLKKPFFLYLLPLFFILHGITENLAAFAIKEAVLLLLEYLAVSVFLAFLFRHLYKDFYKASLAAFLVIGFHLFFGSLHDFLKNTFPGLFIIKYSFLLPAALVLLTTLVVYLKKRQSPFIRTGRFLNFLLCVLILIDITTLFSRLAEKIDNDTDLTRQFSSCNNCPKPDIYLIIADEYAGNKELADIFSFDNTRFEDDLRQRGFHIVHHPKANYNATVYSVASMLNMEYLENLESNRINHRDMFACRQIINNNNVLRFFKKEGYTIYNYSFFDFDDKKNPVTNPFFISKRQLFTSQTFISRIRRDLGFHFHTPEQIEKIKKLHLYNNRTIDSLARINILTKTSTPKFVYTHLMMPHHPYYLDSNGKEVASDILTYSYAENKKAYVEYLLYTNKRLLSLVDHIKRNPGRPPIILLMSDHGYKQLPEKTDEKYFFMNLNAVLLPNGNYVPFYNGMSNINEFRALLNAAFGQKLPFIKDSTIFLKE